MKFSIITPSFNQGKFLQKTIDSVISQKGNFEIEYIVMDGGSTDNSVDLLKKTEALVKNQKRISFIWQSKKDKGQSDAINKGLKMASGDILAFINSDDYYALGTFAKVATNFKKQPNRLWLTGYCAIVNEKNQPISGLITRYKNFWLNHYSYTTLLILNYISQPATFWKKEVRQKFGDFDQNLHLAMDYDYWLRIGANNPPIIIQETLSNFRVHTSSKGGTQFQKQFEEDQRICEKHTTQSWIHFLHRLHNSLITTVYRLSR